jgi:hypothetical protein
MYRGNVKITKFPGPRQAPSARTPLGRLLLAVIGHPAVPGSEADILARLRVWAELFAIPTSCVDSPLQFRRDHAPTLGFEDTQALVQMAWGQYQLGQASLPQSCEVCDNDITPLIPEGE